MLTKKANRSSLFVPRTGLEPARPLWAPAPQAGVSTNFTTWANTGAKVIPFFITAKDYLKYFFQSYMSFFLCWCKAFYHYKFRIFAQNKLLWTGRFCRWFLRISVVRKRKSVRMRCFLIFSACILPDIMPILFRCVGRLWWYCFLFATTDWKP